MIIIFSNFINKKIKMHSNFYVLERNEVREEKKMCKLLKINKFQ